jgi:hypothetical protein
MHTQRWRYRCPEGHTSWTRCPSNSPERQFYCDACRRYRDDSAHHAHLIDTRDNQPTTTLTASL